MQCQRVLGTASGSHHLFPRSSLSVLRSAKQDWLEESKNSPLTNPKYPQRSDEGHLSQTVS